MEFSRQESWNGLPFLSPKDLPNPGTEPGTPALQANSLLPEAPGKPSVRMKWSESRSVMSDSLQPHGLYSPLNSPGQNTGVGSLSLLQEIFPTQGLNPDLPHYRQILYQLSHKGSLRIPEWAAYPFSRNLPDPGIKLGSPAFRWIPYQLSNQGWELNKMNY